MEMSSASQSGASTPVNDKKAKTNGNGNSKTNGKKELKILMLHGYTQSGTLFKAKTGALHKLLRKALSPPPYNLDPSLIYPTGPHNLRPSDIPGYVPPEGKEVSPDAQTDNWAWFRRDEATGTYRGFSEGMLRVAEVLRENGGVDGIIGFSQGGAMAALVAAALEQDREVPEKAKEWVSALREANGDRPVKFCVVYSGFYARDEDLQWMYKGGMKTPGLHYLGSLDSVVEEIRSRGLIEAAGVPDQDVVVHPGGHYVPVSKEWIMPLVGFLRKVLAEPQEKEML